MDMYEKITVGKHYGRLLTSGMHNLSSWLILITINFKVKKRNRYIPTLNSFDRVHNKQDGEDFDLKTCLKLKKYFSVSYVFSN